MALTSPGVEVVVIDESQYIPSAVNTVPYFLVATAQNKADAAGIGIAAGTTAANANKTYLITSQRDLAATFGVPFFYSTTAGTPINGYELNEYGLLAAYSALGVSNRAYIQRVDIDLTELTATLSRPTGNPNDGTYWLDTSTTVWGVQEWNQTSATFTTKTPLVITDTVNVVNYAGGDYTPIPSYGSVGDYAVSAVSLNNPMYYKNDDKSRNRNSSSDDRPPDRRYRNPNLVADKASHQQQHHRGSIARDEYPQPPSDRHPRIICIDDSEYCQSLHQPQQQYQSQRRHKRDKRKVESQSRANLKTEPNSNDRSPTDYIHMIETKECTFSDPLMISLESL